MTNNRYRMIFVFGVFFLMLSFTPPDFAADNSLQVICVDSSGNPLPNVKVVIYHLNSQKSKDKKSDDKGIADFAKLDNGVYQVVGRKDGFAPALYEYAVLKDSPQPITLKFTAGADKKLYFEDPSVSQRAATLWQQGLDAYKASKPADAEKLFRESIDLSPSNPYALYYLALANWQQSKFAEGVELLNRNIKLTEALMAAPQQPGQPDPKTCEQINAGSRQVLRKMPEFQGNDALQHRQFDAAVTYFTEALKTDPDNPDLYYDMAVAFGNANKSDEALKSIDKAIQMRPTEKAFSDLKNQLVARKGRMVLEKAQAIMDEGNKLLESDNAADALKKFEEARNMVPQDIQSPVWRQVARAQAKLNQPDAAIESFKKSIELAPADKVGEFRSAFAQFYIDSKKYDEAVDVVEPLGTAKLVDFARRTKDKEPQFAKVALERVIKTDPQNIDAYFDLGELYYIDGKEKDSRTKALLTKYIELGKDADKLEKAKNMMVIINKRSK